MNLAICFTGIGGRLYCEYKERLSATGLTAFRGLTMPYKAPERTLNESSIEVPSSHLLLAVTLSFISCQKLKFEFGTK
jgi:hypothetical protein